MIWLNRLSTFQVYKEVGVDKTGGIYLDFLPVKALHREKTNYVRMKRDIKRVFILALKCG
jgi:hypothetical protein